MLHRRETIGWLLVTMLFAGPLALSGATPEIQRPQAIVANLEVAPIRVDWLPQGDYESLILTVSGPGDFYLRQEFGLGQAPSLSLVDAKGDRLSDGIYRYELQVVELRKEGKRTQQSVTQAGYLSIQDGGFVEMARKPASKPPLRSSFEKDVVQNDSLVVQGGACIGRNCEDGDGDNAHVLNLKDDNLRINFIDPSSGDWALEANVLGLAHRFSLIDLDTGNVVFGVDGGAPATSLYVTSNGNVGLGTLTPANRLDVRANASGQATARLGNSSATGYSGIEYLNQNGNVVSFLGTDNANGTTRFNSISNYPLVILTNSTERIRFPAPGGNYITAANGATLSAGGTWTNASSRASKRDIIELSDGDALKALHELTPVTFRYKEEPDEQYVGFIAEDVPDLVATNDHKRLSSMDVVAVLTKVVKDQQKTIDELSARLADLEAKEK